MILIVKPKKGLKDVVLSKLFNLESTMMKVIEDKKEVIVIEVNDKAVLKKNLLADSLYKELDGRYNLKSIIYGSK